MRKYQLVTEIELTHKRAAVCTCNSVASLALSEAFSLLRVALGMPEDYYFRSDDAVSIRRKEKLIGSF